MAYCTLDEVLVRMGQEQQPSATLLERVTGAIAAATTAIDNDTNRSFGQVTATRTFGVEDCTSELWVPDLLSVAALSVDDDDDGVFETVIDAAGFELDTYRTDPAWPFEIIRLTDRSFPYGGRRRRRVEVEGEWGWDAVPEPINQACSLLAIRLVQRPQAPFGVVSFGDLGSANIRAQDPDYQRLIHDYVTGKVGMR